jgi:hypothetical protein
MKDFAERIDHSNPTPVENAHNWPALMHPPAKPSKGKGRREAGPFPI